LNYNIATSFVLLVLALAGWGAFAHAVRTAAELERGFDERLRALTADRDRLQLERDQWRRAHDTLHEVEKGFMAARATLAASEAKLSQELAATREQAKQAAAQRDGSVAQLSAARGEVATLKRQLEQRDRELLARQVPTPQPSTRRTNSARAD
jgi:septal ring factor EnvC (AmiA/AmiB activator)